jgi:polyvinyl alcohol dehydrogenase (cytochrome)
MQPTVEIGKFRVEESKLANKHVVAVGLFALSAVIAITGETAEHPGTAIYKEHCAVCHDNPTETRAPSLTALQHLDAASLRESLGASGSMAAQAASLDRRERSELVEYLAMANVQNGDWIASIMCAADQRNVDLAQPVTMSSVGVDLTGHRHLSAMRAGITSAELQNLELAWAIGFPNTSQLRTSPVIVGDTMFYAPNPTGTVLALHLGGKAPDAKPCVKWVYPVGTAVRSSMSYGQIGERGALVFSDRRGQVHAVDASSGTAIWTSYAPHSERGRVTGAPVIFKDKVLVNVSGSGVASAMNPTYECCAEHGSVTALDAISGNKVWTYHTMQDAEYTGEVSRTGVKLRGPSGAPIWSTPTIDAKRNLVIVTTGENTSLPATATSDAVLALDIDTGKLVWGFQALANDVWNMSCRVPWENSGPNCPPPNKSVLKDYDFGAAAILTQTQDGKDILLAGQKSGDVWALDPDNGARIWNTRFGQGTALGGIHWGIAIDGERVFAAIYDPSRPNPSNPQANVAEPGLNAVNIATGAVAWRYAVQPDCSEPRKSRFPGCARRFGFSAAPIVVDKSVLAGGADGRFFIFDSASGKVQFQYDTLRDFETINGVEANGGSIDSHSIFAGAGMVFVGSGYGSFGQPAGNVLLAFRPKR